jgi:peptide/nickel transport system substrate-binding protein
LGKRKRGARGISRAAVAAIIIIILAAAIAAYYALTVGRGPTGPQTTTGTTTGTATQANVTLTAGFLIDVTSINPVHWFTISDLNVLQLIYNTLVQVNSSGLPAPGLAQSWTISPDGRTYTFEIVRNATWHDGKPVTAEDVAFTLMYWKKVNPPYYGTLVGSIENATVIGPYTVRVTLSHPLPGFLLDLADLGLIIPKHIWQNVTNPVNQTNLVGSGPFQFVSRTPGVDIILKANPNYWRGAPRYGWLVIKIFSSVDAAIAAVQRGDLQFFQVPPGTNLATFQSYARVNVITTPSTMIYYITFQNQRFPFNDTHVRRAIAYAVDKAQIISLAFNGQGYVADSILTPALAYWYNGAVPKYGHNLTKAVEELRAAGFSNATGRWVDARGRALEFELLIINQSPWVEMANVIQQNLAQIGIKVNIVAIDQTSYFARVIGTHDYQMTVLSWRQYFDPLLFLEPSFHSRNAGPNGLNFGVYLNPQADELLDRAGNATSLAEERTYVYQLQSLVAEDLPWINIAYGQDIWTVQSFIGWRPVPRYGLWYYDTFENLIPIS